MMPTEDAAWVGAGARAPLRPAAVVVHAHGDRRQPLGDPARPPGHEPLRRSSSSPGATTAASTRRSRSAADDGAVARPGNVGPPVAARRDHPRGRVQRRRRSSTRELAHGDVAAVLMEPALTNIGIVLPEPGYLEAVRGLTREHGTLLINDETHTFSAGPGGATRAWDLDPDIVTIGKAIAGGMPVRRVRHLDRAGRADRRRRATPTSSTPAASAARWPATRSAWRPPGPRSSTCSPTTRSRGMTDLATRFAAGVQEAIDAHDLAVVGGPDRRPRRVPLRLTAAAHGQRGGGRRRPRARGLPARLPGQPRRADHPVPPHGADVPGDHRRRTSIGTRKSSATLSTGFRD